MSDFDAFLLSLSGSQPWKDELDLAAFQQCGAAEQAEGIRRVIAELERGEDERLPHALALMSDFATAAPVLARAIGSANPGVRARAARALSDLVDGLITRGLGECLSSRTPERAAVATALGDTPGVLAAQILADHLDDPEVGEASQKALANRFLALASDGTTEQLRRLGAALHSSDGVRRATAIDGLRRLAQLGGPGAAAALGERFLPDWLK